MRKTVVWGLAALTVAASACSKKNSDVELAAARKALEDARANRAADCAKDTFKTAESILSEAQELASKGDHEAAKAKAQEAESIANQARAASPPDCDKPKDAAAEDPNLDKQAGGDTEAGAVANLEGVIETVYFDYNQATIREDSKAMLSRAAEILSKSSATQIEIEGHCDSRGSTEYNLHLGERRAHAVEKYLTTQGVKPEQISIISYGEERLVDLGDTEAAHQRNRRAEIKKR